MNAQIKTSAILALALLTGCEPSATPRNFSVLPEELKDCKFFELNDSGGGRVTVGNCPNSTTTVQMGNKARTTTVLINGKEYIQK
jgi:hypothetical protein